MNELERNSEYLQCEGAARLTLFLIVHGRVGGRYESKTQCRDSLKANLPKHLAEFNVNPSECSPGRIEALIDKLISHRWLEWSQAEGRWYLAWTETGKEAWEGKPPSSTIAQTVEAIPVVLRLLERAKNDVTLRGDPRLWRKHVKHRDLLTWAAHYGVQLWVCDETLQTVEGRGWATKDQSMDFDLFNNASYSTFARYRITEDGEEALAKLKAGKDSHAAPVPIPIEITDSLGRFETDNPKTICTAFIMMEFGDTRAHKAIATAVKDTLAQHGFVGLRADDKEYHEDKWLNIKTYMHGCQLGIAIFDRIKREVHNPNVALEVGYMFGIGKKVCLLKDNTLPHLPGDLVGKLYRSFDPQDPSGTIPEVLSKWLNEHDLTQPATPI